MAYQNPKAGARREASAAAVGAAIVTLTVSVGTGSNTVADVGASFNQTTLNNNFRSLADKLNTVITTLRSEGIIAG